MPNEGDVVSDTGVRCIDGEIVGHLKGVLVVVERDEVERRERQACLPGLPL